MNKFLRNDFLSANSYELRRENGEKEDPNKNEYLFTNCDYYLDQRAYKLKKSNNAYDFQNPDHKSLEEIFKDSPFLNLEDLGILND
jgi:hypothetical protein